MAVGHLRVWHGDGWRSTLLGAALVFVCMRLVSAAIIMLAQRDQPSIAWLSSTPYLGMTMHWDAVWFHRIAMWGYPHHLPESLHAAIAQNRWAFYPGFPFVTRLGMVLIDTNFAVAATIVNLLAGLVAAVAMARLLETRIPRTAALAVVAVWAALPMAPTLQLAYSEALAMGLLSLALLWLVRERWGRAAVAALALGLTRPILPPLVVVYAVAAWRRWRRRDDDPLSPAQRCWMLGGLVLTGAGSVLWPVVAWRFTGVPGAYEETEAAWHRGDLTPFTGILSLRTVVEHSHVVGSRVTVIVAIVVVVVLTVLAIRSPRLDPVLVTWCAAYLVWDLAVDNMHTDELRVLLPLFPLVAVACGVAADRLATTWRLRVWVGTGLGIVGQYAWVMLCVRFLPGAPHAP